MAIISGPLRTISINGRPFAVAGDGDATIDYGSPEITTSICGDGTTAVHNRSPRPWSVKGVPITVDESAGDSTYINDTKKSVADDVFTFTEANGTIWTASGKINGEATKSTSSQQMSEDFAGGGSLVEA